MNVLQLTNIHYTVHKKCIFKGVAISIKNGECIAIAGENGSGKSTLLKIIAGLIVPNQGDVKRSTKNMGYVPEQPPKLLRFTANEYLKHMGQIQGLSASVLELRSRELIREFGLEAYQHTNTPYLSKGNKQKVNIIQALLTDPELLLLDEPLSGLDSDSQERLIETLTQLKKEGTTIVFTSHESYLAEKLADRKIHVTQQQIKETSVAGINNHYRTIEFTGKSETLVSFVCSSTTIIKHVYQSTSSHIITVYAEKSNEVISNILTLGGTIQFVSRQMNVLPKLESKDAGRDRQ
ncbi:ATP-binding cassette domain-containing protein [Virgibacillus sp. FSP13]